MTALTVEQAIERGSLRSGSTLERTARAIQEAFKSQRPMSREDVFSLIERAVKSVNLELPGIINVQADKIVMMSPGNTVTTILSTGQITIQQGGKTVLNLIP